ncbi:hypothetical protein [Brevibacillus sp. SAFN-007a]|uniref:hypothetical protein n=1 Tax=Brevibacillus sp. SAFN-007a TaxID=3436862 RepID=UPI003F7EE059
MGFTVADWMIYTMWAVFGFLLIDFLIVLFRSFWAGTFHPAFVLGYLKDILYYVLPLNIIVSMTAIDPTGWILVVWYFIGGLAVIAKYLLDIIKRFE